MHRLYGFIATVLLLLILLSGCNRSTVDPDLSAELPSTVDYNFHVKPILSDRCYNCHGPDPNTREADLRLDTPEGFYEPLGETKRRFAVVRKSPKKSELIKRIYHTNPEEVMPPHESNLTLTPLEKAILTRWVEQGAEWKPHWAFIPPKKPGLPDVKDPSGAQNEIDYFVFEKLEQQGLAPSPEADKELLIRRVTFDLTGLPPTIEEIDTYLDDTAPNAYEKLVDRLLSTDAYGERMASEWLDVARYADTGGYQSDRMRRMWPWRDWVVQAFNKNLPFDDFLTWQLAGDLLPDPTREQRLATAFNRNHRQTEEGGSIEEEFRTEYVADRVQTTATAFLGLTMECARCHDHKYDPISQKEYFQFYSFFNRIDESGQTSHFTDAVPVPAMLLTSEEEEQQLESLRASIEQQEIYLLEVATNQSEAFDTWLNKRSPRLIPSLPVQGLVTHLPLDRINGERTPNQAQPLQPGTLVYNPITASGRKGNAVKFDGENGIEVGNAGNFKRTDPFSLSFWMKAGEWNAWNVLIHHTKAALDAGSRGYEVALQGNQVVFGMAHMWPENAIRVISEDSLRLNQWHHIAITYDGSSRASGISMFIDGKPKQVEIVRDNLFKNITYERTEVNLTLGFRFRDTGFGDGLIDELKLYNRALVPLEVEQLAGEDPLAIIFTSTTQEPSEEHRKELFSYYLNNHNKAYQEALTELRRLREAENELISPIQEMMVMKDMEEPRPSHILIRGAYDQKGEQVYANTPEALLPFPDSLAANRLGLSQWLLHRENPLTARVAVNRYWQLLFGTGLVATPEDFGNQGALPSHPELLDWLAVTFRESGWDIKGLLKLMVMSASYRQSSMASEILMRQDPFNEFLARGPSHRLSAEMIRDQAIAASGALVYTIGGPPVKPYQPAGLWKEKSGREYVPDTGDGLYRRSLYTFWKRTSPPPSMITFDASRRNQCIVRRQSTSTPLQALVLLNDPQFVEASRILAERVLLEAGPSIEEQVTLTFRLLTSRHPSKDELNILLATYSDQFEAFIKEPESAQSLLSIGDKPANTSLNPVEWAAHMMVASTIMNLDASIIKR